MTTRTFKQQGQGYGSSPVSIVATLDGNTVYSGTIPTVDQPLPALPNTNEYIGTDLFTWTADVNYAGTFNLQITVTGGTFLLTETLANYVRNSDGSPTGAGVFGYPSFDNTGRPTPTDPPTRVTPLPGRVEEVNTLVSATVNGVAVAVESETDLPGQWYILVPSGATLNAVLQTEAGFE